MKLIINEENSFQKMWDKLLRFLPEKLAIDTINLREKLIIKTLENPEEYYDKKYIKDFIKALNIKYIFYIHYLTKVYIHKNHFADIFKLKEDKLLYIMSLPDDIKIDKEKVISFLLEELILNNNLFQFSTKDEMEDYLLKYSKFLSKERYEKFNSYINFDIKENTLNEVSGGTGESGLFEIDTNEINTTIYFVIPYQIIGKPLEYTISKKEKININVINSLYDDPIFNLFDMEKYHQNGMPVTFLSDVIGYVGNSSLVKIVRDEFYHPDFDLINGKIVNKDFKLERAKHGGLYYPHKDYIIDILFKLFEEGLLPESIDINSINTSFISNLYISYSNKKDEKILSRRYYLLTNKDSYKRIENRFIQKITTLYLNDDFLEIRDLILNVKILNKNDFLNFCYKLLEITIKKSIEFGGLYNSFWIKENDKVLPLSEVKAQIIIYNYIKDIAEIKGIKIIREPVAADGSLDFYFHYTKNDISMNVCVELKNAHHNKLIHGIKTQLPLYIKSLGKKEGIFLVLWYKTEDFTNPSKYISKEELEKDLSKNIPSKFNIKTMVIDCSPKVSPSKSASSNRM